MIIKEITPDYDEMLLVLLEEALHKDQVWDRGDCPGPVYTMVDYKLSGNPADIVNNPYEREAHDFRQSWSNKEGTGILDILRKNRVHIP